MPDGLIIALIALALWILYPLVMLTGHWLTLIRVPVWPVRLSSEDPIAGSSPLHAAMIAEVESLGFQRIAARTRIAGPDRHTVLFFRHRAIPAFAVVTFEAEGSTAYPVVFTCFDNQSNMLSTCNRAHYRSLVSSSKIRWHDPYADSLAEHWIAHLDRVEVQTCKPVCNNTAMVFLCAAIEANFTCLQTSGSINRSGEHWHYTAPGAAKLSIAILRVRHKLNLPYSSSLTQGALRSAYLAECLIQQRRYEDPPAGRGLMKPGTTTELKAQ